MNLDLIGTVSYLVGNLMLLIAGVLAVRLYRRR